MPDRLISMPQIFCNRAVHRDIKPNNIMVLDGVPLGTEGSVKILDFGIAKLTQHDGGEIQALTKTGEIFGSPIYMSPEQCTGEKTDYRCDIYSLGCVIFEALTGTPPFVGESALSTMMMHQTGIIPTLKEASLGTNFSPELERLVHTMLSKNPDERYRDLGVAAQDLAAIKNGDLTNFSLQAKPNRAVKAQAPSTLTMKRNHMILWIASVAVVSTVSTFLIMQLLYSSQKSPVPTKAVVVEDTPIKSVLPELGHTAFIKQINDKQIEFRTKLVSDADLKNLEGYKDAQSIEVSERTEDAITNQGLSYLTSSKLLKLTLHGQIEKVDNYAQLKNLQSLQISKSPISDKALANIAKMKMLSTLNLDSCTVISENGIRKLIPSTSINWLVLTKGKYSRSFIDEMHKKMPQCKIENYGNLPPIVTENAKERDPFKRIRAAYERLQAITPNGTANAQCLYNMGVFRAAEHKYTEARKLLDEAIHMLDKNQNANALPAFLRTAAETANADHDDRAAVKYTDRLVEILPSTMMRNDPLLFDIFASILQYPSRLNDWSKVTDYCNVVIPIAERFPDASRAKNRFEYYSQAGDSYIKLNKKNEALENYNKLEQLSATNRDEDFYWHASAIVRKGRCLPTDTEQKESYLEGIRLIEAKGMPDTYNILEHYCDACVNVGVILLKEGKWEEAVAYNKKGLAAAETRMKDPKHTNAKARVQAHALDIISILKQHGRIEEARAMAKRYHFKI